MKRTEIAFAIAVAVFAAVFIGASVTEGVRILAAGSADQAFSPTAGEPRDVDMEKLRSLLRSRFLSEKEALHYKRVDDSDEGD